jgi:glycosyltransferase involved in cell wall biosynthesis
MQLAIVIPAYNEAACIEAVILEWLAIAEETDGIVIVVNDGSRDCTGKILDEMALRALRLKVVHQANAGHGVAVMRGYREAIAMRPAFVFQTDSDDQFKALDFWKLWEKRSLSPFVLGYREARQDPLHRLVITRILRGLNFLLFGASIKDANIPYRLIRTGFLRGVLELMPDAPFAPNIFLSILGKKTGCTLFEIPITHQERHTGTVSIMRWRLGKACLRSAIELAVFRARLAFMGRPLKALRQRND